MNGVHLLLNAELNAIVFSKLNAELNANRKTPERKVNAAFRASVQLQLGLFTTDFTEKLKDPYS